MQVSNSRPDLRWRSPQPFIDIERDDTGQFQIGCVYGEMNCRLGRRDGKPAIESSWEGHDENENVFGRGWAVLDGDDRTSMLFFHLGDESGFVVKWFQERPKRKRE